MIDLPKYTVVRDPKNFVVMDVLKDGESIIEMGVVSVGYHTGPRDIPIVTLEVEGTLEEIPWEGPSE